jgi:hypothetical protein
VVAAAGVGGEGGRAVNAAASGPILRGLRLQSESSPKMRAQVGGPLEFSNS